MKTHVLVPRLQRLLRGLGPRRPVPQEPSLYGHLLCKGRDNLTMQKKKDSAPFIFLAYMTKFSGLQEMQSEVEMCGRGRVVSKVGQIGLLLLITVQKLYETKM